MNPPPQLSLVEELALLAIREDTGRPRVGWSQLQYGFAGAILAELAVTGRIGLDDKRLHLLSPAPTGHPLVDQVLQRFTEESKPHRPGWWIPKIGKYKLRMEVFGLLVARRLVTDESDKVLGIFPMLRLQETDPALEAQVKRRIQQALDGGPVDDRTGALIGLAAGCELLKKVFPTADKKRVKAILADQWAGQAVKDVLESVSAAVAASIVVTAAAAS